MTEPNRKTRHIVFDKWQFDIEEYETAGTVDVDGKKTAVGKGFVPNGGIVLKNVYHGGYRLAYDMGIVGVWVYPGKKAREETGVTEPKYLRLGAPDFRQLNEKDNFIAKTQMPFEVATLAFDFSKAANNAQVPYKPPTKAVDKMPYNFKNVFSNSIKGQLKVKWVTRYPVFGTNSGSLFLTQKILFTDYSAEPAHEPSGGLTATRLHPFIEVHYPNKDDGYVESIRLDYRLYLGLDMAYGLIKTKSARKIPIEHGDYSDEPAYDYGYGRMPLKGIKSNQAGLFRDDDSISPVNVDASPGNTYIYPKMGAADTVFSAAEKPIKYEVIGNGLIEPKEKKTLWDNIHWWGSNGGTKTLPSTPGAFHATHIHWRWGVDLQKQHYKINKLYPYYAGEDQFVGEGKGGVLTDPRIDLQKIEFAIVKNENLPEKVYVSNTENHGTAKFEDFFKAKRGEKPTKVENGNDLVLYYSVSVDVANSSSKKLPQNSPFEGVFFIHGLFFAHEREPGFLNSTGAKRSFYKNPDESGVKQDWNRNPKFL